MASKTLADQGVLVGRRLAVGPPGGPGDPGEAHQFGPDGRVVVSCARFHLLGRQVAGQGVAELLAEEVGSQAALPVGARRDLIHEEPPEGVHRGGGVRTQRRQVGGQVQAAVVGGVGHGKALIHLFHDPIELGQGRLRMEERHRAPG